jgi:acyl CoA:acetate/3-ketoacid CoA transferase
VVVVIKTKDEINKIVKEIQKKIDFSGVVLVKKEKDLIYEKAMEL